MNSAERSQSTKAVPVMRRRQTSALASQVRPDESCAGVSLGAYAPIGAPALPFQNAHKSTCVGGNISR
jgi:hypothetical protein